MLRCARSTLQLTPPEVRGFVFSELASPPPDRGAPKNSGHVTAVRRSLVGESHSIQNSEEKYLLYGAVLEFDGGDNILRGDATHGDVDGDNFQAALAS